MKTRILVVDDESMIRDMLRQVFESDGYEVYEASDGMAAQSIYQEEPMDLIITDLAMPMKNGLEVIDEVTRCFPQTKIIAMSANASSGSGVDLGAAQSLGAHRTFPKPFPVRELKSAVKALLAPLSDHYPIR
ncbi:MAG: response regulator [Desulfatibacillum sp.]|nr:response regulator [Desulfatibacillum sp.]